MISVKYEAAVGRFRCQDCKEVVLPVLNRVAEYGPPFVVGWSETGDYPLHECLGQLVRSAVEQA